MAWQEHLVTLLRSLIFDMDEPYTYSDNRLEEILVASALQVIMEVNFANAYTINLAQYTINPDPVHGTEEVAFQVLVARKAASVILFGEFKSSTSEAVMIKDGPSTIDLRDQATTKKSLADNAKQEYDRARTAYLVGDGMQGKGIVTPYNIGYVGGTFNILGDDRSIRRFWS